MNSFSGSRLEDCLFELCFDDFGVFSFSCMSEDSKPSNLEDFFIIRPDLETAVISGSLGIEQANNYYHYNYLQWVGFYLGLFLESIFYCLVTRLFILS